MYSRKFASLALQWYIANIMFAPAIEKSYQGADIKFLSGVATPLVAVMPLDLESLLLYVQLTTNS